MIERASGAYNLYYYFFLMDEITCVYAVGNDPLKLETFGDAEEIGKNGWSDVLE